MKMRDRGEYERKNPSPLIQQQFLSQSNFADCPVDREEVHFLCLLNQVGTKSEEGSSSFFALTPAIRILPFICPFIFGSIPKSQFDTFGDFIFTVICEQWQTQWTNADGRSYGRGRLLPLLHLLPMRGGGVHFLAVFDAAIDSNCEFAPA